MCEDLDALFVAESKEFIEGSVEKVSIRPVLKRRRDTSGGLCL